MAAYFAEEDDDYEDEFDYDYVDEEGESALEEEEEDEGYADRLDLPPMISNDIYSSEAAQLHYVCALDSPLFKHLYEIEQIAQRVRFKTVALDQSFTLRSCVDLFKDDETSIQLLNKLLINAAEVIGRYGVHGNLNADNIYVYFVDVRHFTIRIDGFTEGVSKLGILSSAEKGREHPDISDLTRIMEFLFPTVKYFNPSSVFLRDIKAWGHRWIYDIPFDLQFGFYPEVSRKISDSELPWIAHVHLSRIPKVLPFNVVQRIHRNRPYVMVPVCRTFEDFLDTEDMFHTMTNESPLNHRYGTHDDIIWFIIELMKTVKHIHDLGLVHGNICLTNLVYLGSRGNWYIRGFEHVMSISTTTLKGKKRDKKGIGFPSPEYDIKSSTAGDVWSIGKVYLALCTGLANPSIDDEYGETINRDFVLNTLEPNADIRWTLDQLLIQDWYAFRTKSVYVNEFFYKRPGEEETKESEREEEPEREKEEEEEVRVPIIEPSPGFKQHPRQVRRARVGPGTRAHRASMHIVEKSFRKDKGRFDPV